MKHTFSIKTKLWRYPGPVAWHFVTIKKPLADQIKAMVDVSNGWGQIKVEVHLGASTWFTSLFPSKGGEFMLAIKASIRKAEKLKDGDMIEVTFSNY